MKRILAALMALVAVFAFAACSTEGAIHYSIGNEDAATYFYREYNRMVEKYGKASFDGDKLSGVAVVRLMDFTGDGEYELYFAFADGTKDYVNRQMVVGFDRGSATILDEEITSKAKAEDTTPCIWLYEDEIDRAYVVTGDVLTESADYRTFVGVRGEEKFYKFCTEFTVSATSDEKAEDGTYEKINLTGLTQEDADYIFEENKKVVDSIAAFAREE